MNTSPLGFSQVAGKRVVGTYAPPYGKLAQTVTGARVNCMSAIKLFGEWFVTPRPAEGADSAPSWSSRITPKPLQILTQNLIILHQLYIHRMTKFCGNRPANFLKIEVLVGSPHANFDQNRINVEKFDKKQDLKANRTKKKQETCKMTRSTKWLTRNFEILSF